jgi:hypothetical protein
VSDEFDPRISDVSATEAGRKKKSSHARRLVITRNGLGCFDVKVSDMELRS